MEFDESKVRIKWSDELNGKKGWFSDSINDDAEQCLRIYVESNESSMHGTCTKGDVLYPFKNHSYSSWKYFYPEEDVMEFDKKNLFIAGYNDEDVNIGDEGIVAENIDFIKKNINNIEERTKIADIKYSCFCDIRENLWSFFYRTKCAPKDKYIPWTKETAPDLIGKKIISKDYPDISSLIIEQKPAGIYAGIEQIEYYWLFNHYTMDDGSPCGHKVQDN